MADEGEDRLDAVEDRIQQAKAAADEAIDDPSPEENQPFHDSGEVTENRDADADADADADEGGADDQTIAPPG